MERSFRTDNRAAAWQATSSGVFRPARAVVILVGSLMYGANHHQGSSIFMKERKWSIKSCINRGMVGNSYEMDLVVRMGCNMEGKACDFQILVWIKVRIIKMLRFEVPRIKIFKIKIFKIKTSKIKIPRFKISRIWTTRIQTTRIPTTETKITRFFLSRTIIVTKINLKKPQQRPVWPRFSVILIYRVF